MNSFTKELLHIDDIVVYLKNERTGSSTIRKCKFIGQVIGFTTSKVEIMRLSPPDTFVIPEECRQFCTDKVYPDDVVQIIISKYQEDDHIKTLKALNDCICKKDKDIKLLIGKLFSALEDNGVNPWKNKECVAMANKYWYTEEYYKEYLRTII